MKGGAKNIRVGVLELKKVVDNIMLFLLNIKVRYKDVNYRGRYDYKKCINILTFFYELIV